jgi:hypothetical protein
MRVEVAFRGEEVTVVIDDIVEEPDVNAYSLEYHFLDEKLNAVDVTAEEEEAILDALWQAVHDHRASDD